MSLCLPGLQGFPIQVSGWSSIIDKSTYMIPSDISFQFSPTKLPMSYMNGFFNINGTHTFFIGGSQYFVKAIRLCKAKQEGLSFNAIAEFHIWGFPTATSTNMNSISLISIPINQGPVNTAEGDSFVDLLSNRPVQLDKLIPSGPDVNIVRYSTCVETNINNVNIVIAYWEGGIKLDIDSLKKMPTLQDFGVPTMSNFKLLSSYVISSSGKTNRIYTERSSVQQCYPGTLTATNNDFKNGFRYIKGFVQQVDSRSQDPSAYKCVNIDPSRDIKNGKILIDPSSGKRLSEVEDAQAENNANIPSISPKDILENIAITIGTILGIVLLLALFKYVLYPLFVVSDPLNNMGA
jgi:hypothetical protein